MKFSAMYLSLATLLVQAAAGADTGPAVMPTRIGEPPLPAKIHLTENCERGVLFSPAGDYLLTYGVKLAQLGNETGDVANTLKE